MTDKGNRVAGLGTIRHEAGLTQMELTERSGLSYQTIAKLELGLHMPGLDTLQKLEGVLGDRVYKAAYGWRREIRRGCLVFTPPAPDDVREEASR